MTVPFVIRTETGFLDRDQYRITTLVQPGQAWEPWAPQRQFNGKLLITHGSGCGVEYQYGNAPSTTLDTAPVDRGLIGRSPTVALSRGFAVLLTALGDSGHNCHLVTQAESLVMAKERFVERYGELRYTIGMGCSGGSIALQQVANAYPGIYDGLVPQCSFPDAWSTGSQLLDLHILRGHLEHGDRGDTSARSLPAKVIADRPADVGDTCEATAGGKVTDANCPLVARTYASPRMVAGDSIATTTNKCALKPLRREDYSVAFTDGQWAQLRGAVPIGVCDFSVPGIDEAPSVPWQTYSDSVGGPAASGGVPVGPRRPGSAANCVAESGMSPRGGHRSGLAPHVPRCYAQEGAARAQRSVRALPPPTHHSDSDPIDISGAGRPPRRRPGRRSPCRGSGATRCRPA